VIRAVIGIETAAIGIVIAIETVTAGAMVRDVTHQVATVRETQIGIRAAIDPDVTTRVGTTVPGARRVTDRTSDLVLRPALTSRVASRPLALRPQRPAATNRKHHEPISPGKVASRDRLASAAAAVAGVAVAGVMAATPHPTSMAKRAGMTRGPKPI